MKFNFALLSLILALPAFAEREREVPVDASMANMFESFFSAKKKTSIPAGFLEKFNYEDDYELGSWVWEEKELRDGYHKFLRAVGKEIERGACKKFDQCFWSSKDSEIAKIRDFITKKNPEFKNYINVYADCSKLPKLLEAIYLAYNGKPFTYRTNMKALDPAEEVKDGRYRSKGNVIGEMRLVFPSDFSKLFANEVATKTDAAGNDVTENGEPVFIRTGKVLVLGAIVNELSTAAFRTNPSLPQEEASDYYSPSFKSIDIGTNFYSADGHVLIVYEIDRKNGTLHMMDAHPGGHLSTKYFDESYGYPNMVTGAGFRSSRPFKVVKVKKDDLLPIYSKNENLKHFSMAQFKHTKGIYNWKDPKSNKIYQVGFIDRVKLDISEGKAQLDPRDEMRTRSREFCKDIRDRISYVETARVKGIPGKPHPDTMPGDISMGGSSDWQEFSSPSRDSHLKEKLVQISAVIGRFVSYQEQGLPNSVFHGTKSQLATELLSVLEEENTRCTSGLDYNNAPLGYTKSDGEFQPLTMKNFVERVQDFSFDPYHCVELRWGAPANSDDVSSCDMSLDKWDWYQSQSQIRNLVSKPEAADQKELKIADLKVFIQSGKGADNGFSSPKRPNINIFDILANMK